MAEKYDALYNEVYKLFKKLSTQLSVSNNIPKINGTIGILNNIMLLLDKDKERFARKLLEKARILTDEIIKEGKE